MNKMMRKMLRKIFFNCSCPYYTELQVNKIIIDIPEISKCRVCCLDFIILVLLLFVAEIFHKPISKVFF
jgi:hypothetical protein